MNNDYLWNESNILRKGYNSFCCRGRRKSYRGYHFRYTTENEIKEYKNNLK